MQATSEMPPPQVRWDLSALFSSMEDPRIQTTWEDCLRRAESFAAQYRGTIDAPNLTAEWLCAALREIESIYTEASKPINYAHLRFAANTSDPAIGAFLQRQMERMTALNVCVMFFELELQQAKAEVIDAIVGSPALASYRHHIQTARMLSPHRLTEPEEIIVEEMANTGTRAWVRLFEEVTSNHAYRFRRPDADRTEDLTQEEILDLLRSPDRAVRQAAADCLSQGLAEMGRVLSFSFNNLLLDKKIEDRLRKHPYPEHARHLTNELDRETVDLVIDLCRKHYTLVHRFYRLKRELLGLPELTHIDRYAPLFSAKEQIAFDDAQELVLDAFGEFSPEMRRRASEFFDSSWIDAEPRPGKSGGAFCASVTPDLHPVVFLTYMNSPESVSTLAHELGHGVHASLSRAQTYLNFHGTLPMAELASTFGEMLVFEKLLAGRQVADRLALVAEKLENTFATVFRQAAMYRFEQRCHAGVRADGELPADAYHEMWQEEIQAMFGDSLKLGEQHRTWWTYVSHFVASPFYVYAYSFGELLVLALYEKGRREGAAFAERYIELLRLGGSRSPQDLMATVGVDLRSPEFWEGGFDAIERLVAEFERLAAEHRAQPTP